MERIRQHLSYANVTATLALVFAMSGGAIAATGGFTSAPSSIKACVGGNGVLKLQAGKKCRSGQKAVSWSQQGPAGAQGATGSPGATGPQGAPGVAASPNTTVAHAATADTATTALTADNTLALGGIPASGFTRSDCASTTGQIKGFALVPAIPPFGWTRVSPSYNCSGQAVEAIEPEPGAGIYVVRFQGNPAEIAMATAVDDEPLPGPGVASVKQLAPGEFEVFTASPSEQLAQQAFELLLP
jgi:hypothetical protein